MKAAIFRGGDIVVDTLPEPVPAKGHALVKVLACGICGSDLHAARHSHRMVEVSRRIREEFDNGKHYYALHGQRINAPKDISQRPHPGALAWHNEHCFRG